MKTGNDDAVSAPCVVTPCYVVISTAFVVYTGSVTQRCIFDSMAVWQLIPQL